MREYMDGLTALPRVQLFATDIDEMALGVARHGRYPEALLDSVSPERRKRFFIPDGGSFVLAKEVRDLCIFSPHSIIRDPPFSRIDLVSCRNLLIYFGAEIQNQVIPIFHYSLRPGGYLFLGTSENASQFSDLFTPVDKKNRIFRSRDNGARNLRLPLMLGGLRSSSHGGALKAGGLRTAGFDLRSMVETQVLERFAPAHVVTNREGEIVHYSGKTGKYLEAPVGIPNRQITAMARKGLRIDLRGAFREAVERNETVIRERIAIDGDDGRIQMTTLTVEPVRESNSAEPLFIVLFNDEGPALSREEAHAVLGKQTDGDTAHIERELRDTKDRLQSMMEEYETALEELKSTNEELVSVNEELQSTNEELEASKEELQSLNEEMHTVNAELASKVDALDQANNDLQNLFESTQVATVFLDKNLVIRSFTPAITEIFNILPNDVGRPLTHVTSKLDLSSLENDILAVFSEKHVKERQLSRSDNHAHYLLRVIPYLNTEGKVDGVVLTFIDISSLTEAEANQRILVAELQHRTRNLLAVIHSIANQTVSTSHSLNEFRTRFNARLAALSRVQGLLSASRPEALTMEVLVQLELDALNVTNDGLKVVAEGPGIVLPESVVRTLALALHELATNAAKHGAFSVKSGSLRVTWNELMDEQGRQLELHWVESGVPISPDKQNASQHGFGRILIERALPYQLRAQTHYELGSDGVHCSIKIPLPLE
jgi:two-component system CheB/CheR fusion protein